MRKPSPKKNAECEQCHRDVALTMPVGFAPGWPMIVWQQLCLQCRTSVQMSRHWDRYCIPAYHLEHSADGDLRDTYRKWLAVESL